MIGMRSSYLPASCLGACLLACAPSLHAGLGGNKNKGRNKKASASKERAARRPPRGARGWRMAGGAGCCGGGRRAHLAIEGVLVSLSSITQKTATQPEQKHITCLRLTASSCWDWSERQNKAKCGPGGQRARVRRNIFLLRLALRRSQPPCTVSVSEWCVAPPLVPAGDGRHQPSKKAKAICTQ